MSQRLSKKETAAIVLALHCEIASRHAAAHNDLGERCEVPRGKGAIDDEVPAMESALRKLKDRLYR